MIAWFVETLRFIGGFSTIWLIIEWVLRVIAVFVMPKNRRPTAGLTWLTLTFLIPPAGWVAYLILGNSKLPLYRRRIQKHLDDILRQTKLSNRVNTPPISRKFADVERLAWSLTHLPVSTAKSYEIISDYHAIFHAIARDIDAAKHTIHLEYYTLVFDRETEIIFTAIERAVERGVKVRVLYDAYGSWKHRKQFKHGRRRLRACGADVRASLPFRLPLQGYTRPDLRNHRKLVTIDGQIGYSGSQNIISRGYHRRDGIIYNDLVMRCTGAIVRQLDIVFAADWYAETEEILIEEQELTARQQRAGIHRMQVLPSGPGYEYENNLKIFNTLIYSAEKSILIVNPYFVPDESLMTALVSAARRGIQVTMVNSKVMDQWMVGHAQRSYYEELFLAGVRIYWHEKPSLLHSKFMIIDDEVATIGSSNMDIRSFELDHELTLICYDQAVTKELATVAAGYLDASQEVDKIRWLKRPRYRQVFDNIARLTSSLQ